MQENKTAATTEAPKKRVKKIDWKVDNLRHISDHGSLAQFADEAKAEAVRAAFFTDGVTRITAGQSRIEIETLGHVSETRAFFSVGSNHVHNLHYRDNLLKYKFEAAGGGKGDAYDHLKFIIFSGYAPSSTRLTYARKSAANSDEFRTWFKKYSWVFAGENGLRAQAINAQMESKRSATFAAQNMLQRATDTAKYHELTDYAKARADILTSANYNTKRSKRTENELIEIREKVLNAQDLTVFQDWKIRQECGYSSIYRPYSEGGDAIAFRGTPETTNPRRVTPNYSATVDGEKITLSSGLVCPFSYTSLIQFLKNDRPINTSYGLVKKLETADAEGNPKILITCGCHIVDAAKINEQLAQLLTPSHKITVTPATPELRLTDETIEEFRARCLVNIDAEIEKTRHQRARDLTSVKQRIQQNRDTQANHATRASELQAEIEKAETALDIAKTAEEAEKAKHKGATLDDLKTTAILLINALVPVALD